jgi:N-acetylglucosamine-6-phosphate deacetylase
MKIEFPGFFDLQVNGFAGVDFNSPACTPDDVEHAIESLRATGVTRLLPTLITSSFESFSKSARLLADHPNAAIFGIHMEGPYIAAEDGPRGAHPRSHVSAASIEDFTRRQDAARGRIVLVTLAPEAEGVLRLTEHLVESGVRVAIGHTAASPGQIRDAMSAGATLSTHLGNGCAQMLPRHPNFLWEQLAADELFASFIVDGHHLPAAAVKAMVRAKTAARTILVTDATAAAASAPGHYTIGEAMIELTGDGQLRRPGAANLAGSALSLNRAVGNTARFTGLGLDEVLPMASTIPARYMGAEPAGRVRADWDQENYSLVVNEVVADNI